MCYVFVCIIGGDDCDCAIISSVVVFVILVDGCVVADGAGVAADCYVGIGVRGVGV